MNYHIFSYIYRYAIWRRVRKIKLRTKKVHQVDLAPLNSVNYVTLNEAKVTKNELVLSEIFQQEEF